MTERSFNFKYENRDKAKTIPVTNAHVSENGTFSVTIDQEDFESIFRSPTEAISAYNRSVIHG